MGLVGVASLLCLLGGSDRGGIVADKTLADYLKSHPWNVQTDGPMVVLEPEAVKSVGSSTQLSGFGRKAVKVGALSALVPTTMIVIDDSLKEAPNLYEGLPSREKVLYLLRSLTEAQWKKVAGPGLGLADLQGEQKLVMDSLLPNPFKWSSHRITSKGMWGADVAKGTLSDTKRKEVRLRVERQVNLEVTLKGGKSYSTFGADRYRGVPGDTFYQRDMSDDFVQKSSFGLKVRKELANQLKAGDLDFKSEALRTEIALPTKLSIRSALKLVQTQCGIEVIPDFRVADRNLTVFGSTVKAREILQAIALSVSGTYRKVGPAYVLTADREGMGTRKLRLASWEEEVRREVQDRTTKWMVEIGKAPGFGKVKFDPTSTVSPDPQLEAKIRTTDEGKEVKVLSSDLGPGLRKLLDQWDSEYTRQPIEKDVVGVNSSFGYRFILPNGEALMTEGSIGVPFQFRPARSAPINRGAFPAGPLPIPVPESLGLGIFARPIDESAVESFLKSVSQIPGSQLWLATEDERLLSKAIELAKPLKVNIGLVLYPWRGVSDDPDRNLMGETGAKVRDHFMRLKQDFAPRDGIENNISDWATPMDPTIEKRWRKLAKLAKTEGLFKVALRETQPFGYEPEPQAPYRSMIGPLDWAVISHGFSEAERLAFLRKESIDPIDIGDGGYYTTPDLRQPFFFDDGLRGMPSIYDGTDDTHPEMGSIRGEWQRFLGKQNREAMMKLLAALEPMPVYIEPRLRVINQTTNGISMWPMALYEGALPEVQDRPMQGMPTYPAIGIMDLPDDTKPDTVPMARYALQYGIPMLAKQPNLGVIVDFTKVSPVKFDETLKKWFKAEKAPPTK